MSQVDELLAQASALLAAAEELQAQEPESDAPEPAQGEGVCTRCKSRPVRKAGSFLCAECKGEVHGRPASTGFVASRIRASKTERPAKQAASRAFAERVVASLTAVPAPKRAGAHAVVTTPEVMRAVNAVATPRSKGGDGLPGEVGQRAFDAKAHAVTVEFDSAARAKAFASAAGDAATS